MDIIAVLDAIKKALGTLIIQSTPNNVEAVRLCFKLCDTAAELSKQQATQPKAVTEGENG